MTEPFRPDGTSYASLSILDTTLNEILETYRSHPDLKFSETQLALVERNSLEPIRNAAAELEAAISKMRASLRPVIRNLGLVEKTLRQEKGEAKAHQKTLAALDEALRFMVEIRASEAAEARFSTWLNLGRVPFLPIRQDYFSFHGPAKQKLKRPDFILYNRHRIVENVVIDGEAAPARITDAACVDVKAFNLSRDRHGAYFVMPDQYMLHAQIGMDDKAGARSFWCLIPPETENLGILIDLNHLTARSRAFAPGEKVYFRDVISVPLNLLHIGEHGPCADPVEQVFLFDQLASNHAYDEDFIRHRRTVAIDLVSIAPRDWSFLGVHFQLPYPDEDGMFTYNDPVGGGTIIVDDERHAAIIEYLAGSMDSAYPVQKSFLDGAANVFPGLMRTIGHWLPRIRFTGGE
ncbi:hypothetical protein ACFFP0_22425 [Rhizobium puerariae]|uniref:Uncharacterized protein n=1 Tax=Rhizobium puerariae TaxID=1585791 RepID=A0ABV6ALX9_9HYPH